MANSVHVDPDEIADHEPPCLTCLTVYALVNRVERVKAEFPS